jgi:PAS domain S-box-containing protein
VIEQVHDELRTALAAHALEGQFGAILDAVADGVTVQDRSGRVVYANAAAVRLIGFESADELVSAAPADILTRFELFDEAGDRLPVSALPGRRALEGVEEPEATVGFRVVATGEERWATVRATPMHGPDGTVRFAINTFHDITDRVRMEAAVRASEARYRQLVEAMPQIAWMTDRTGAIVLVNRRWTEYTGEQRSAGQTLEIDRWIHPDDQPALAEGWLRALAAGETFEAACRLRRRDGTFHWHLLRVVAVHDDSGTVETWIGTSTDIDAAKRAEDGLRLLARASERLESTLSLREVLEAAVELAVPDLADWALIDVVEADGSLRRAALAAGHPALEADIRKLLPFPPDPNGPSPAAQALRTGQPVLVPNLEGPDMDRMARSPEHLAILGRLGPQSGLALPLIARDRTLGVLQLLTGRSGRRYTPPDRELASTFATRVALAASNARLYAAEEVAREAAEASASRTDRLARAAGALVGAFAREEVVEVVLRDSIAGNGATGGAVVMRDPDRPEIEVVASMGLAPLTVDRWRRMPLDEDIPFAVAVRNGRPVWIRDYETDETGNEEVRAARRASPNGAACAVPIVIEGRAVGALGLTFAQPRPFDDEDRRYITAYADLAAQALDRVSLSEAREALLAGLDEQRGRLETVLRQMPAGVIIAEAPSGRMLLTNAAVEQIWRGPMPRAGDLAEYDAYTGFHSDGRRLRADEWPLARAVAVGETVTSQEIEFLRGDGSRGWLVMDAAPVRDRDGRVVAAVGTMSDVTDRRARQENQRFLADAAAILGSSLEYEETIARVAELAVPRVADWCIVDLSDDDGTVRRIKIAHANPERLALAERYGEQYPPDPVAPTGPYAVIRSGVSELISNVPPQVIDAAARNAEQRELLHGLEIRSYMCVPLRAGERPIGAITFVGGESGRRFTDEDLAFAEDLAARAAAAVERARLFRDVGQYKRLVDASVDALFMIDPQTLEYTYVNDGAVEQLGRTREDLVALGPAAVIDDLDTEQLRAVVAPLVDGSLESRTVTLSHRHASGRLVPVEVLLQHVDLPGTTGRIVAVARDMTDRVEVQARLERLAESEHARAAELNAVIRAMGDGLVVCDARGRISLSNPAARDLFGGAIPGSFGALVVRLDDPDGLAPALGSRAGPIELRVRDEDAPERWVELSTFPVSGAESDSVRAGEETIVLLRDVTAVRRQQVVRDAFLGVLSHELRTPVTTIFAASKVLAKPNSSLADETRREMFEDIRLEAERLHRLVEDVIALTRFGDEGGDIGNEPVLLQRILPGVVSSEIARWPSATFRLSVPVGLPTVVADPTYVEQVVRNLLSNAAKYGGGGVTIDVSAVTSEEEVTVRIVDDGPGFPADEADRLFERFFRSPTTAGRASGAGIGLFVCARLIHAMGGRIWAVPRPTGGAEFGFSLRVMAES